MTIVLTIAAVWVLLCAVVLGVMAVMGRAAARADDASFADAHELRTYQDALRDGLEVPHPFHLTDPAHCAACGADAEGVGSGEPCPACGTTIARGLRVLSAAADGSRTAARRAV